MAKLHVTHTSPRLLLLLCLCTLLPCTTLSQPSSGNNDNPYPQYPRFGPSMAVIVAVLVSALFFMVLFSIYVRHCSEGARSPSSALTTAAARRASAASRGLDPAVVATFPTFPYSDVKGLKLVKGALECAVCLNEFEDDETLRLIPKCDHVFHPDCIDAWLASHVTCPVCRANLVPQPGEPANRISELIAELESRPATENEVVDGGDTDLESGRPQLESELPDQNPDVTLNGSTNDKISANNNSNGSSNLGSGDGRLNRSRTRGSRSSHRMRRLVFPRSHSTGHSLVQPGDDTERFTLRLPVDVRKQIVDRQLNRAMSMVALPRGGSSRTGPSGQIGAEGGSSRGRYLRRGSSRHDRRVRSDRWLFGIRTPQLFSRAGSVRSPRVAAASNDALGGSIGRVEDAGSKAAPSEPAQPPV